MQKEPSIRILHHRFSPRFRDKTLEIPHFEILKIIHYVHWESNPQPSRLLSHSIIWSEPIYITLNIQSYLFKAIWFRETISL